MRTPCGKFSYRGRRVCLCSSAISRTLRTRSWLCRNVNQRSGSRWSLDERILMLSGWLICSWTLAATKSCIVTRFVAKECVVKFDLTSFKAALASAFCYDGYSCGGHRCFDGCVVIATRAAFCHPSFWIERGHVIRRSQLNCKDQRSTGVQAVSSRDQPHCLSISKPNEANDDPLSWRPQGKDAKTAVNNNL